MAKLSVRRAVHDDIPQLQHLLGAFVASLDYKNSYLPPPDRLVGFLSSLIENHVVLVAVDGPIPQDPAERVVGAIGGEYFPHPFNHDVKVLYDHFWYVYPTHRQCGVGGDLLDSFLAEAKDNHAVPRICLEYNTPLPEGFMERRGLRLAEKTYILE